MPRRLSLSRSLLRLLDRSAEPIYLLDAERRIAYGNAAFAAWVGRPAEELLGVRADYHASRSAADAVETASALCPPPEAFIGQLDHGQVAAVTKEGQFDQRTAAFRALRDDSTVIGVLVIVHAAKETAADQRGAPAASAERIHSALQRLRAELGRRYHIGQLIGQSDALKRVRQQVKLASQARTRVLIVGPEGSGREHVAKTIHYGRLGENAGPLVPIDCRLMDAEQMQTALTEVLRRYAESAVGQAPTALLLDVDQLRADAQQELASLLLLPDIGLQTLATARTALQRLAAKGKFRSDLAYALSTITIALPPLKSRPADIPLLAQFFLEECNAAGKRQISGCSPEAMEELVAYKWPGNLDELSWAVREAASRAAGPQVLPTDLPARIHLAAHADAHPAEPPETIRLDDFLADIERELLTRALHAARGNKSKAAQMLGLSRPRLLRRLVQLGLAPPPSVTEPVVFEPVPEES